MGGPPRLLRNAQSGRLGVCRGLYGFASAGCRMFTFGQGFGQLEGILVALGYQIIRVTTPGLAGGFKPEEPKG